MLREISELTLETDGRYATDVELAFLDDYCDSLDLRISAYHKIANAKDEILDRIKAIRLQNKAEEDALPAPCRQDLSILILHSASALLFDDLERLRTGMLLWHQTISRSFHYEEDSNEIYEILVQVIPEFVSDEELQFVLPAFELDRIVLV